MAQAERSIKNLLEGPAARRKPGALQGHLRDQ